MDELRLIEGAERDRLILDILNRIDADKRVPGTWDIKWAEQLELFRKSPCEASLVPLFIRPGEPVRWRQQFYQPADPWHELEYVRMVHGHIGDRMQECETIHEFGCGSGYNLVALAKRFPEKLMVGYDRSEVAVELASTAAKSLGLAMEAYRFDMAAPNGAEALQGDGVFTFGALEQLGPDGFQTFIDYLIDERPRVVVHIEPIPELLDPDNIVDALSLRFHRRRRYTEGLLDYLHGKVDMLSVERSWFGSKMLESYAQVVWKPL